MNIHGSRSISVSTGSRLHFGLTRYQPDPRDQAGRFGGVGVMIDKPGTEIRIRPAAEFSCRGSQRIDTFARAWASESGIELPGCEFEVVSSPPAHSGLGSGTQLAHAVATGLNAFLKSDFTPPKHIAQKVAERLDRGKRSMIGSFGFALGGLIVDGVGEPGRQALAKQVIMPSDWRVVLVLHRDANKKFGVQEQAAFDNIATEQNDRSRRLEDLIAEQMVPAAESGNFEQFCSTVHDYSKLSGEYYADVQGGIYNGPVITSVVDSLLRLDAQGVGQSSWGPVVFSWCENQTAADELLNRIGDCFGDAAETWVSRICNHSARVSSESQANPGRTDK